MTSKFPETQSADHAANETGLQAEKLAALRSAVGEIEERHSDDEASGFEDADVDVDFEDVYAQAKKTAMNILAMRDHSSLELAEKLAKRDHPTAVIEVLIEKLQTSNLLNDEEFAQRFVRAYRQKRKLSRGALQRELKKKGITNEIIAEVVDEVSGEEDLARQVAEKKATSSRGLDYEVRQRRILGMLARRGFASSISLKVTYEVLAED